MRRALTLAVLVALAAPTAASAQWSDPILLHSGARFVFAPQAMFAARGDAVVGYGYGVRSTGDTFFTWTRTIPGGGPRFFPRTATTNDPGALLATYASNRLLLVNQTFRRFPFELDARFASTSTSLGRAHRLMPGYDTLRYAVAVDQRGNAVVAALARRSPHDKYRVVVVRRPAGSSFGRPETIAGRGNAMQVGAAVTADGELVVAYERSGRVEVRTRRPGHSWTSPQNLGPAAGISNTRIAVAAGQDGAAVVAWASQPLSEGGGNGSLAVRSAVRSPGGHRFHSTVVLERGSARTEIAVAAGLDAGGRPLVAWTGAGNVVRAVTPAAGASARNLGLGVLGDLAVGRDGAAVAVWSPLPDAPNQQVFAASRVDAASDFSAPEAVSPVQREVTQPTVAIDPRTGEALAAWAARTGDREESLFGATRARP